MPVRVQHDVNVYGAVPVAADGDVDVGVHAARTEHDDERAEYRDEDDTTQHGRVGARRETAERCPSAVLAVIQLSFGVGG